MASVQAVVQWVIYTHVWPHLDEMLAIFFLVFYGESKYPGISKKLHVEQFDLADPRVETWVFADLWDKYIIPLGIGPGPYNEHGSSTQSRVKDECTASLVAKDLGIDQLDEVKYLLELVRRNDLYGEGNDFLSIAKSLELRFKHNVPTLKIFNWIFQEFKLRIADQKLVWSDDCGAIASLATHHNVRVSNRTLSVYVVSTDNDDVISRMRSEKIYRHDVIMKHSPTSGQFQVLTNHKSNVDLSSVVYRIRLAECKARGIYGIPDETLRTAEGIPGMNMHAHKGKGGNTIVGLHCGGTRARKASGAQAPLHILEAELIQGLKDAN